MYLNKLYVYIKNNVNTEGSIHIKNTTLHLVLLNNFLSKLPVASKNTAVKYYKIFNLKDKKKSFKLKN